ncbi:MAG: CRISPR-associated CARF protein Csa3 [Aeropyrum sp.]|nr:CRISPR-associated CARF protein Csa3 [Aeropyrum sp.]
MAGRLFALTLGFHENYALRTLSTYHGDAADVLIAYSLSPIVHAVKTAFQNLSAFAHRIGLSEQRLVGVDPAEGVGGMAATMLDSMRDYLKTGAYTMIVADPTGGARAVSIALYTAVQLLAQLRKVEVYIHDESGVTEGLKIEGGFLKIFDLTVRGEKARILRLLTKKPGLSPPAIAEELGIAEKTVYNSVAFLKKHGLAYSRGRGRGVFPTGWGRLLSTYYELEDLLL